MRPTPEQKPASEPRPWYLDDHFSPGHALIMLIVLFLLIFVIPCALLTVFTGG